MTIEKLKEQLEASSKELISLRIQLLRTEGMVLLLEHLVKEEEKPTEASDTVNDPNP